MKTKLFAAAIALSFCALFSAAGRAEDAKKIDIKRAAPTDAFLAVYARHNPERDYQRDYMAAAWKTFQDEHIAERVMNMVTSRVPQEKLAAAKSKWDEVATALAPISGQALLNADEFVMAETMQAPFNHVFMAVRLKPQEAADYERGLTQGCELIARWTEGKVTVETSRVKDATVTALVLPKESPYQPALARLNDIV